MPGFQFIGSADVDGGMDGEMGGVEVQSLCSGNGTELLLEYSA
jgi:hypothetical protein